MRKKWYRLDNAALIFPAIMRRGWNNAFRVSVTLSEDVDPQCLEQAIAKMRPRFPTFFVRLRRGFFWYYLEETARTPVPQPDFAYPLTHMHRKELRKSCIRVLFFRNRIAVEMFHSVTDGTGGMFFLKNLTACYLKEKYGTAIIPDGDIRGENAPCTPDETRDAFQRCAGRHALEPREERAYRLRGAAENRHFLTLTTGIADTERLHQTAKKHGVTVTAFLSAVMALAVAEKQKQERPERRFRPVKIAVAVNLRKVFGIATLRNFALTVNVGFHPWEGGYTLDELCGLIQHQLQEGKLPQKMSGRVAANVLPQKNPLVRILPLPLKSLAMRLVYGMRGENRSCINLSNLGVVTVPESMQSRVREIEFIIGPQSSYPNNCSLVSYGGRTCINMIRTTKDSELERLFFSRLVAEGVPIEIRTNRRR